MKLARLSLADYPKGAMYADGSTPKLKWRWKPVDQKYIDKINLLIDRINAPKVDEPVKKPRKGKK